MVPPCGVHSALVLALSECDAQTVATVRVSLQPKKVEHVAGFSVSGAQVSLNSLGPGQSQATATAKPAKLVFSVSFYEDVRKQQQGPFDPVASLTGSITLDEGGKPVFTLGAGVVLTPESAAPTEGDGLVRELELEFDPKSFAGAPQAPLLMKVPEEPVGTRFLELGVVLEIDGSPEAAQEVNDRLDVPLYQFSVLFLEYENGEPMADARFEVRFAGRTLNGSTDEAGKAKVQLPNLGRGTFRLKLLEFPEEFAE